MTHPRYFLPVSHHTRSPFNRGKLGGEQESSRRALHPGDSSDDDYVMVTPGAHPSLQRGVLRSAPATGAGDSSDLSDDVDDTPISRIRIPRAPRSGGGGSANGGGGNSAGGFRSNAHVAAAAAGVCPTPYGVAAAAMAGGRGVSGGVGDVSTSRRSERSTRDRDRPPSGRSTSGGYKGAQLSGGNSAFIITAPTDRTATRDMAARESLLRFEVERLRVQATSLAAENDGMRGQMDAMRRVFAESEGSFVLQSHELDRLREKALGEGATRAAELEDQCDRQRRMLQELAVASEALAKDNVLLSSELVAVRDRGEEAESKVSVLTERLTSAQRLYLAGQRSLERVEEMHSTARDTQRERRLEELLTPEILTKSRPPTSYPIPDSIPLAMIPRLDNRIAGGSLGAGSMGGTGSQKAIPGGLFQERQKLHEQVTSLRRHLDKATRRVGELEDERSKVATGAAEARKGVFALSNRQQQQLTGALRRLQWLVERTAQLEADVAEKDEYVASLERRLLTQHKAMSGMVSRGAGVGRGSSNGRTAGSGGGSGGRAAGAARFRGGKDSGDVAYSSLRAGGTATCIGGGFGGVHTGVHHGQTVTAAGGRGGGWLSGADGRTPAAREAMGLARRAMAEAEPGRSFIATGSVQTSEDESEAEDEDTSDGSSGGDHGGGGDGSDNRAAPRHAHFCDDRENSGRDGNEEPAPAPARSGKLEMDIEISDDDSDDEYGGDVRGNNRHNNNDNGRSGGGGLGGRGESLAKTKKKPTWGANKPTPGGSRSPRVLRESTSKVLDSILRFEPGGKSRRAAISSPGGGGGEGGVGEGGVDREGIVGASLVAPSQDDLSLVGIQDYITQLQALHDKSGWLATSDAVEHR